MQGMSGNFFVLQRTWAIDLSTPGHALREKGIQKLKGIVQLLGSQEERALLVPVITNDKPVVNRGFGSSIGLHRISLVYVSGETVNRRVFEALGAQFYW